MDRPRLRVSGPTLDAADPVALAEFYERLLGWPIVRSEGPRPGKPTSDGWAMLRSPAGDMKLDPVAHRVERRGRQLQIGPTEYRLIKFFMEHPRRVFSRGQLLDAVWGTGSEIEERTVDVHIRRLRKAIAIENARDPIRTVRSAGYALEPV